MTFRQYRVSSSAKRSFYTESGRFNTRTQKQKKEARTRPKITPKKATIGGQELHPLIRVEDNDDHPELHAVSDSSRWMSLCPTTGFTRVKSVLDSGATDNCTRLHVSRGAKQTFRRKQKGQMYTASGGKKIANQGEKDITMVTETNEIVHTKWQTVDIARPV